MNRTIVLQDTTPPTIASSIRLDAFTFLELGSTWPQVFVNDIYDGNLTTSLKTTTQLIEAGNRTARAAEIFPKIRSAYKPCIGWDKLNRVYSGYVRLGNGSVTREIPPWKGGVSGLAPVGTAWNISYFVSDSQGNIAMLNITIEVRVCC